MRVVGRPGGGKEGRKKGEREEGRKGGREGRRVGRACDKRVNGPSWTDKNKAKGGKTCVKKKDGGQGEMTSAICDQEGRTGGVGRERAGWVESRGVCAEGKA